MHNCNCPSDNDDAPSDKHTAKPTQGTTTDGSTKSNHKKKSKSEPEFSKQQLLASRNSRLGRGFVVVVVVVALLVVVVDSSLFHNKKKYRKTMQMNDFQEQTPTAACTTVGRRKLKFTNFHTDFSFSFSTTQITMYFAFN